MKSHHTGKQQMDFHFHTNYVDMLLFQKVLRVTTLLSLQEHKMIIITIIQIMSILLA